MTCREVVALGRYPYTGRLGITGPRDREIIEETMALTKITDLADRDFTKISDGQRQRVLLARSPISLTGISQRSATASASGSCSPGRSVRTRKS